MEIQFERGDPQRPRGHALLFARSTSDPEVVLSTYCVVLPIALSISKYLPPIFAAQLPPEGLREAGTSVVPIPPMLEDGPSYAQLVILAEHRDDDLCNIGTIDPTNSGARMTMAAEAAASYGQLYERYASTFPAPQERQEPLQISELDISELMGTVMSPRDRLGELARMIGRARYAIEGHDQRLLRETELDMHRVGDPLPEKYRIRELISAALDSDERGWRIAQLYLERAYKLLDEEYTEIPRIEREIKELRGE
jgi:hypothetical protein